VAGLIWLPPGPEAAARELRSRLQSSAAIPHRGVVISRQQINAALQLEGVLMLEQSYFLPIANPLSQLAPGHPD
jgi:hypothetical protein